MLHMESDGLPAEYKPRRGRVAFPALASIHAYELRASLLLTSNMDSRSPLGQLGE